MLLSRLLWMINNVNKTFIFDLKICIFYVIFVTIFVNISCFSRWFHQEFHDEFIVNFIPIFSMKIPRNSPGISYGKCVWNSRWIHHEIPDEIIVKSMMKGGPPRHTKFTVNSSWISLAIALIFTVNLTENV